MYLTEAQLHYVLQNPYFTEPVTQSVMHYVLYRGHMNATVHTLRFNSINPIDENMVTQTIMNHLMSMYDLNVHLLGSVSYDLLLVDPSSNPKSYYIWRANSNSATMLDNEETFFQLTYDNLFRFVRQSLGVHIQDLNIFFRSSNVVVENILAFVFSLVKI